MSKVLRKKGFSLVLIIGILLIPLFLEAAGYRGGGNDFATTNGSWYDSWGGGGGNGYRGGSNGDYTVTGYWPSTYTPTYTTTAYTPTYTPAYTTTYTPTYTPTYTTSYEPSLYTTTYTPYCCWGPGFGHQWRWGQQGLSYDYLSIPASTTGILSNYSLPKSYTSVLPYSSPSSSYNYNSPWNQYTIGQGCNVFVFGGEVTNTISQNISLGTLPQWSAQ